MVAVTEKLRAQVEFVAWWDRQSKNKGGRPNKTGVNADTSFLSPGKNDRASGCRHLGGGPGCFRRQRLDRD